MRTYGWESQCFYYYIFNTRRYTARQQATLNCASIISSRRQQSSVFDIICAAQYQYIISSSYAKVHCASYHHHTYTHIEYHHLPLYWAISICFMRYWEQEYHIWQQQHAFWFINIIRKEQEEHMRVRISSIDRKCATYLTHHHHQNTLSSSSV